MTKPLNWKEIARWCDTLRPELESMFVDRIVVPERERFPEGFIKGEWTLRMTGRRKDASLIFSVRPRHPSFYLVSGKGPKAAPEGTRSPFDLSLSKNLKGKRLEKLEAIERERFVVFWFAPMTTGEDRLGLVLCLVPALPEAILISEPADETGSYRVLTRTRAKKDEANTRFTFPNGERSPSDMPVREELVADLRSYATQVEKDLAAEAFELRLSAAQRELRSLRKQAEERIRQNETALQEAERESDWQRYGDLLKVNLGTQGDRVPEREGDSHFRVVQDYENERELRVPADPKLGAREQVEKFFSLARRKKRRIEEARLRLESFRETAAKLDRLLENAPAPGDWAGLERLEKASPSGAVSRPAPSGAAGKKAPGHAWLGKTFISKDGLAILVGRSRDENLELTFKHARGNDIWMHVRGKPGAHVVIPIPSGKSAPLETLLDAAALTIHYSNGSNWGTTEVDYTFKKYVKRIKDSTEASYVNNKTLLVKPDPERIKRLFATG